MERQKQSWWLNRMKLKLVLPLLGIALLSGCANQQHGLYAWGDYDNGLYEYYHEPESQDEFVLAMIAHLDGLEQSGAKAAPGLNAEVGTFMLKAGKKKSAVSYYEKEAAAWPESKPLMLVLIKNLKDDEAQGE